MRSSPFRTLLLVIYFLALTALSAAAQPTNVVDWSSEWRYYQAGMLPAADWTSTNYSDTHWPSAPGVFATPNNEMLPIPGLQIATPLSLTANGSNIITYYFRTTFDLASTNSILLTASNLIDDGAVIYLNGREVRRLSMSFGGVAYPTLATRSDDVSTHGVETFEIPITNAVAGRNVLAVEVHQGNAVSADIVFGMKLIAEILQPPAILRQPEDLTVQEGKQATFSVHAVGSLPLSNRWFFISPTGTNLLSGATTTNISIVPTLANDGRQFFAVITNRAGSVTSRVATLTVIPDTTGPRLVSATKRLTNQIELLWDEVVTRESGQASSNYTVRIIGTTDTVEVTNALWNGSQGRLLLAGNLDEDREYIVCARNIADLRTNVIASDCIALTFMLSNAPIRMASSWHFATPFTETPATNWTQVDYVLEDFWGEGQAMFAHDTAQTFNPSCTIFQTHLTIGLNTYYFRRTFILPSNLGSDVGASLRHVIDDGAVFYLNGVELLRVRMPAAPILITKSTFATAAVPDAVCQADFVEIPAGLLHTGTNVLAVEVHQVPDEASQNDVAFDTELIFTYARERRFPELTITSTRDVNGQVTTIQAAWSDNAWRLETAPDIKGPWIIQPANGTFFQAPPSGERKFLRLKTP